MSRFAITHNGYSYKYSTNSSVVTLHSAECETLFENHINNCQLVTGMALLNIFTVAILFAGYRCVGKYIVIVLLDIA